MVCDQEGSLGEHWWGADNYHNQAVLGTDDTGPGFVEVEPGIWESISVGLAGLFGIPDYPYNWTSTYTQEDIADILECENAEWCWDYREPQYAPAGESFRLH